MLEWLCKPQSTRNNYNIAYKYTFISHKNHKPNFLSEFTVRDVETSKKHGGKEVENRESEIAWINYNITLAKG